jgi:uncharacterized membrane-anchored protein YitT (DUF2179 family)
MDNRLKYSRILKNVIGITVGAAIYGIAYSWFLIPFKIAPGGIAGLSQIAFHLLGYPAGMTMIVLNIPLFILGFALIGRKFTLNTLFGMLAGSIFTDLFAVHRLYNHGFLVDILNRYNAGKAAADWAMTDNVLLASIAGSILLGMGLGIIFRCRGSTGGTDIPVMILKKYLGKPITAGYLMMETGIIIIIGIVFRDPNLIIWGFFNLLIMSLVCDITAEGLPDTKAAFIISDAYEPIRRRIMDDMGRGVTILHGEGGYNLTPKKILYVAVSRQQISELRDIVREEDPRSFVILNDVHDVVGSGFRTRALDL